MGKLNFFGIGPKIGMVGVLIIVVAMLPANMRSFGWK
jgi:hypothetical protein